MAGERVCIIGSNSFSGAHCVAQALREGCEVIGISRSAEYDPVYLPYRWGDATKFTFHALDLNHDIERIDALLHEFAPSIVINFAAQGMVAQSWQNPEHWYRTNTLAMIRLHERLRKLPSLKRFVQASTPEVYGNTSGLVREDAPFNPSTPYAVSKAACDMNLLAYRKAYDFPVCFTRSANVCGPAQALYRILPRTIYCIRTGQKLRLEGGGTSVRSFIHIQDVVEATMRIARTGTPGQVYHLATERYTTIRELVELICERLQASFADCVELTPPRLGQDAAYLLDTTRARIDLGWTPTKTLEDAIADTADWLTKNLARLRELPTDYIHKP